MDRSRGAALLTSLVLGLTACTGQPARPPAATPSAESEPTALAYLNTAALRIARVQFCDLVPEVAVSDAVTGRPSLTTHYGNGDRADIGSGLTDRVHEFNCTWTGSKHTAARAWVFARPVAPREARGWVRDLRGSNTCSHPPADPFGDPSTATWCQGQGTIALQGRFTDTWLACSVRDPTAAKRPLLDRTEQWCVQVANALNTER